MPMCPYCYQPAIEMILISVNNNTSTVGFVEIQSRNWKCINNHTWNVKDGIE